MKPNGDINLEPVPAYAALAGPGITSSDGVVYVSGGELKPECALPSLSLSNTSK